MAREWAEDLTDEWLQGWGLDQAQLDQVHKLLKAERRRILRGLRKELRQLSMPGAAVVSPTKEIEDRTRRSMLKWFITLVEGKR